MGPGLLALALSTMGVAGLRRWPPRVGLVDIPNERRSHDRPTPRGGGLSFVSVAPSRLTVTPEDWWQHEDGLVSVTNEFLKFALYWLKYGVSPFEC